MGRLSGPASQRQKIPGCFQRKHFAVSENYALGNRLGIKENFSNTLGNQIKGFVKFRAPTFTTYKRNMRVDVALMYKCFEKDPCVRFKAF